MNMNVIILSGNLGKDVELKKSATGTSYADGSIAVNDNKKNANFINFRLFGKYAETMTQFLVKGAKVTLKGSLQVQSYQGKTYVQVLVEQVELNSKSQPIQPQTEEIPF